MKKFSLLTLIVLLSGCAANVQTNSTQQGPKESAGAISGMIIGGALANDMAGDSRNKSLATVLGAFVGGVIGQNIGAQLDERDRLLAGEAYNTALEYNATDKAAEWRNPDTGSRKVSFCKVHLIRGEMGFQRIVTPSWRCSTQNSSGPI